MVDRSVPKICDSLPPVTRPSTLLVGWVAVKVAVSPTPTLNWSKLWKRLGPARSPSPSRIR